MKVIVTKGAIEIVGDLEVCFSIQNYVFGGNGAFKGAAFKIKFELSEIGFWVQGFGESDSKEVLGLQVELLLNSKLGSFFYFWTFFVFVVLVF